MRTPIFVFLVSLILLLGFWLCVDDLKGWQTLIGALVALLAALIAVFAQRIWNEEQRRRRLLSHRALLPEDLSRIARYARQSADVASEALVALRTNRNPRPVLQCPTIPERVLDDLRFLIENLDNKDALAVADLVSCYQVQHARLASELEDFNEPEQRAVQRIVTPDNVEHTFGKTVELELLIDNMWGFARREATTMPPAKFSAGDLHNALLVLNIFDVMSAEYRAHLERTYISP